MKRIYRVRRIAMFFAALVGSSTPASEVEVMQADFKSVTNRIPIHRTSQEFIRLNID